MRSILNATSSSLLEARSKCGEPLNPRRVMAEDLDPRGRHHRTLTIREEPNEDVMPGRLTPQSRAAADGEQFAIRSNDQEWIVAWYPSPLPPRGTPHGAQGICVTSDGKIVVVSEDGERWGFPAGRPEPGETWEETLRREMLEEACATVVGTRLLGFTRGECVEGPERSLVLVRSMWRADVELGPWDPQFEIRHRHVIAPTDTALQRLLATDPFAPIIQRSLNEAAIA